VTGTPTRAGPPPDPPTVAVRRPRRRSTLAWRITASCLLAAVAATAAAGVVAARLLENAGREVGQHVLADQADVLASQFDDGPTPGVRRVADVLRGQGVTVVLIGPAGRLVTADATARTAAELAEAGTAAAGRAVSAAPTVDGHAYLVEARAARSGGFALVQRVDEATAARPRRVIVPALAVGGAVAVLVGVVGAALIARPLQDAATAARTMRAGRRETRIPVRGPREVADVATAVNELADALERSEARQRRFLLSVSHELRTPLTSVAGFAESLADGVVSGADVPAAGRTIQREAHRLHRLVDDLMELARLDADDFRLDPVPTDLAALLTEAGEVWSGRCRAAGVRFRLEIAGPVVVRTDPRRLRQVVDGLAENALRVTPAGAELVFALRAGTGSATVEIRDGGPGLRPEDQDVVFDRGALHERYRDRRPVGAGGIGLALVHGLVTRMGATIASGDAPEGGALFAVHLPA
jgi:signal transduction histidine kinase